MHKSSIKRRELLKISGTGFGLTGIVPTVSTAVPNGTLLGRVVFVEVSIGHEDEPAFPVEHSDDFPEYRIGKNRNKVNITPFAIEDTVEKFRNGELVATDMYGEYKTLPEIEFGGSRSTSARLGPTKELHLVRPYRSPTIKLTDDSKDSVKVTAENASFSVAHSEKQRITLSPRQVTGRQAVIGTKTIDDPRKEGREIEVPQKGEQQTAVITPVVEIVNYGWVEVYSHE